MIYSKCRKCGIHVYIIITKTHVETHVDLLQYEPAQSEKSKNLLYKNIPTAYRNIERLSCTLINLQI